MNKKIIAMSLILAVSAAVSGCGTTDKDKSSETVSTTETSTSAVTTETETASTAESTETETTAEKTSGTETVTNKFASIAGDWYIDGDTSAAHISISDTGTFTSYYATSGVENRGYIEYAENGNGDTSDPVYVLYTDDGSQYIEFKDDGSERKQDMYSEGVYGAHFVRIEGAGGIADDGIGDGEIAAEEDYLGTWGCNRATLTIYSNGDGTYLGTVTWSDSAFAYVEWTYTLSYENGIMVCNENAVKKYYEYKDGNPNPEVNVMYDNGSGSFTLRNGVITWYDAEENLGEDMEFIK